MCERDCLKLLAIKNNSENYWSAYKTSRNRVTQALREAKTAYYKKQFVCIKNYPGSEINCITSLSGQITCSSELVESFNSYFTSVGLDIANTIENSDTNFMDYLTKTTTSVFQFQAVSVAAKVNKFLRSLNACKFTGIDKIPAKIIRIAAPVIADLLTKIFNTAIFNETIPFEWKIARVIPLHKKGP